MKIKEIANLIRHYRKANIAWYQNQSSMVKRQVADTFQKRCEFWIIRIREKDSSVAERLQSMFFHAHNATLHIKSAR